MATEYLFNEEVNRWLKKVNLSRLPPEFENMTGPWKVRNISKEDIINKILGNGLNLLR